MIRITLLTSPAPHYPSFPTKGGPVLPRPTCEPLEPRNLLSTAPIPVRINAGGPALIDSLARPFEPDSGFTGGQGVPAPAGATADTALFASYRIGPAFTFARPVPNGNYNLFLEFADPVSTAPGQRTFDVSAEGALRLDDLDIYKENAAIGPTHQAIAPVGAGAVLAKSLDLTITDGQLDLAFTGVVGDAIVSAINLIPTDIPDAARPYVPLQGYYDESTQYGVARNGASQAHSASNLRMLGMGLILYANQTRGYLPPDLKTLAVEEFLLADTFASPRTDTLLPRGDLSYVERVAWVAQLDDYFYLGAGRRLGSATPPQTPLAYENPDRVAGQQIVVLFADAHVEYLDRADAAARIGFADAPPTHAPATQDPLDPALRADPRVFDSQANLRAIGKAMLMYSNDHKGTYPATPGPLNYYRGTYTGLAPQTFANPRGTTAPPPADLSTEAGVAWIDASRDYVYLGAGKRSSSPADTLLAFENPAEMTTGLNFLFADFHTEFREYRWALETIARAGATSRLPLPGDATRDGVVNFDDLLVLAKNYNKTDQPFTAGDFNYDNVINFDDLLLLAQNYNRTITVPVPTAAAAPTTTESRKPQVLSTPTRPPAAIAKPAPVRKHR
jgi:hypothetical protein